MNAYTVEVNWTTEFGSGRSHIYAQADTSREAMELIADNFGRQGYTVSTWGSVTAHGPLATNSLIDFKCQPCKNGVL